MENKNDYLLNLVIASVAISATLFLLNKYWNKGRNKSLPATSGDAYNNTDMPVLGSRQASGVQKVQIVEEDQCLFPDGMVLNYDMGETNWGELNPNAPDFPQNRNMP